MLGAMYCLASLFENFEKNVFIKESGKAIPTPKFQNKGGHWKLQASCTVSFSLEQGVGRTFSQSSQGKMAEPPLSLRNKL